MGLLSFFKRQPSAAREPADPAEAVQRARTTARRRLLGAVVLLGVGVIGFPLLFETQPRPIPVDIPIDIPRKESAAPLEVPAARAPARAVPAPAEPAPSPDAVVTERAADAGREVAPPAAPAPAASSMQAPAQAPARAPEPERKPAAEAPPPAAAKPAPAPAPPREDAQRARALLEGKASEPAAGRFVVQVGAFADPAAVREARAKVEKLGLKTYTQVVDTASGKRTRVRVGPFSSRDEADKASSRMRSAGLAPAVLTL